jgi:hypothetical protein
MSLTISYDPVIDDLAVGVETQDRTAVVTCFYIAFNEASLKGMSEVVDAYDAFMAKHGDQIAVGNWDSVTDDEWDEDFIRERATKLDVPWQIERDYHDWLYNSSPSDAEVVDYFKRVISASRLITFN